ncbi:MAG: hypothetical protein V8S39_09550 [Lachnospiraceae bacterium]
MEHFQENQNDLKRMEMLRAALPYIPVSMQKFLSIYIGLEELFNAIRIIREGPVLYMDSLNYQPQKLGNTEELVKVLRGFCSPKENELIDMFFQMSNMMNMYDQYKDMFSMFTPEHNASPAGTSPSAPQAAVQTAPQINPADIMNMMKQFQDSNEIDNLFKDFTDSKNGD